MKPRVLVLANTLFFPPYPDEWQELNTSDVPRPWILDVEADLVYVDQRLLTDPPGWLRRIYQQLPMRAVQILEAYRVGHQYDAVFCWSVADVSLGLALLLKMTGRRLPTVALLTRISEPKKAILLRLAHSHLTRIVLPPVTQREYATQKLGVPAEKFDDLPWTVNSDFWKSTRKEERDTICAAGGEMRDYPSLVLALKGLDIPCHVAGVLDTTRPDWWNATDADRQGEERVPSTMTFETMPPEELRALYNRSRFVVVPLHPTDSDNGITCMNEAWSMGRAVIVSAVTGQRDAFIDGVEGLWVPPEDPEALREAILRLWDAPQIAEAMGAAGRKKILREKRQEVFSRGLTELFRQLMSTRGRSTQVPRSEDTRVANAYPTNS